MSSEIGVGILGLGAIGMVHARALRELAPRVRLRAFSGGNTARAAQAGWPDAVQVPAEALPEVPGVDVVAVCSPSAQHGAHALSVVEAGRHVVVEKPMASDVREVDEMIAAADRAGRMLTVCQQRRFDPDFLALREVLDSGRLGELVLVRRSIHGYARRADWQMLRKFDGGALSNTAPHLVDQVLRLGMPDGGTYELLADLRHTVGAGDAEDHVKLALKPTSGPLLEVEASSCMALPQPEWLVVGTSGSVSGSPAGLTVRWCDPAMLPPLTVDEGPAAERRYGTGEVITWEQRDIDPTVAVDSGRSASARFYDQVSTALTTGAAPPVTPDSVRLQIEVLTRARQLTGFA